MPMPRPSCFLLPSWRSSNKDIIAVVILFLLQHPINYCYQSNDLNSTHGKQELLQDTVTIYPKIGKLNSADSSIVPRVPTWWGNNPALAAKVTANHKPFLGQKCDHRNYIEFNRIVAEHRKSTTPYNKAVGADFPGHPESTPIKVKYLDPRTLCIRTDAKKNIDVNEFDCLVDRLDIQLVKGYCGCGGRWSQIDLNDNKTFLGLDKTTHSYEFKALVGLDKFLTAERKMDGTHECVAARFGHCTLRENMKKKQHVTKCKAGFSCRNVTLWVPFQKHPVKNPNTGEWYGICISNKTPYGQKDPLGASGRKNANYGLIFMAVLIALTCWINMFFNYDDDHHR